MRYSPPNVLVSTLASGVCGRALWVLAALTAFGLQGVGTWAQKTPVYMISGRVLGQDGMAIRKARVSAANDRPCSDKDHEDETEADEEGHFQLRVPCPGVWRLSGEGDGYPKQTYEQHGAFSTGVVLSAAHPEHEVLFRMVPSSSVAGTVLDEAGDPVRDAKVFLLEPGAAAGDALKTVDQTTTDDRGSYELSDVTAGGYNVAVQVQPWYAVAAQAARGGGSTTFSSGNNPAPIDPSLDVTYPITFYPATAEAASASTVEVAAGATQQADVHLSPVPSVHVVLPSGGRMSLNLGGGRDAGRGGVSPLIQEMSEFGALRFEPTSVSVLPDGSMDVGGFSAGEYALASGRGRDGSDPQSFTVAKDAGRTITLGDSTAPVEQKQATSRSATGTLSGTVELARKPCEGAMLLLVPITGGRIERQQSNTDGSFSFEKVPLGRYILVAMDQGWGLVFKDRGALGPLLTRGLPVDLAGPVTLKQAVEAQARPE